MQISDSKRESLSRCRTVVIKIGSRTLSTRDDFYVKFASELAELKRKFVEPMRIVIVSSGAIALGIRKLGYKSRPKEMAKLQAAAAAGQSLLMRAYEEAFSHEGLTVAQVLLTHADLADRNRANNARAALSELLDAGCIPILNENDSVAVEEIKFGDNDQLSSLVCPLVDADVLLLLSDVDGLLNHQGERISVVHDLMAEAMPYVKKEALSFAAAESGDKAGANKIKRPSVGTGGMTSKIEAVRRTILFGAQVVIANSKTEKVVSRTLRGEDIGTLFIAGAKKIHAKKHWIAFTLRPKGTFFLDEGCVEAVVKGKKSVLSVGVLGLRGQFYEGDAVSLVDHNGKEIGRGLTRYHVVDAARLAGPDKKKMNRPVEVFVHRDELVIW